MGKFIRFLNREVNGLHQAAFFLASASVGAKLLAILRDRFLASSFGAGKVLDIYYASFRLPDLLYVFSLFLVSATALIPLFLKKKDSVDKGKNFINAVFTIFSVSIIFLAIVIFLALPYLVGFITPGFSGEDIDKLIEFSRILLLSPVLLGLSNLVSSVVQSFRRFFIYALSGVLYNVGIIFGLLVLYPRFGSVGVIWGVVCGALLHLLIQVPCLVQLGYFPRFTFKINFLEVFKVIKLSFPRALGLTLNQLVLVAITALASFLTVGSITVFNLASNLQTIPLGIIALSYSTAAFPSLVKSFLKDDQEKFISSVTASFRHILFWLLPITVLFIVLRAQIVRIFLGAGSFTWTDTRLTAAALALFALSLFAQGLILLLVRAFYAAGKTKLPLIINIISSGMIIFFSVTFLYIFKYFPELQIFFENFMRVENVVGVSVLFLPLAYSLGMIFNFFLLFYFFQKEFSNISSLIQKQFRQIVLVSLVMGFISYGSLVVFARVVNIDTFWGIFAQGFFASVTALIVGFFILRIFKNRELFELMISIKRKFTKDLPVEPEPEELP